MRVAPTPAFVLFRKPYRDTSLLLEIFSRDHGRVGLIARGVRSPRSRWRSRLQPFCALEMGWSLHGDLGRLTSAEEYGPARLMAPERLVFGWYLNELLLRLLARHDPHPELFLPYDRALDALSRGDPEAPVLRRFERILLELTGFAPTLDTDVQGEPVNADGRYAFDAGRGLKRALSGEPGTVSGRAALALAEDRLEPADLADALRITRAALAEALQGQRLRTRDWLMAQRRRNEP